MDNLYCIEGFNKNELDPETRERLYWSNSYGWVLKGFDVFTEDERKKYNLPIGGKWVKFYNA